MWRSQTRREKLLRSSFADNIIGGGCVHILAVHTLFVIPSGNENRNFYYSLDISTGKLVKRMSAKFDFYWKQIIETELPKYNITINHKTHILLDVLYCGSSLLVTSPTVQWLQASVTQ